MPTTVATGIRHAHLMEISRFTPVQCVVSSFSHIACEAGSQVSFWSAVVSGDVVLMGDVLRPRSGSCLARVMQDRAAHATGCVCEFVCVCVLEQDLTGFKHDSDPNPTLTTTLTLAVSYLDPYPNPGTFDPNPPNSVFNTCSLASESHARWLRYPDRARS